MPNLGPKVTKSAQHGGRPIDEELYHKVVLWFPYTSTSAMAPKQVDLLSLYIFQIETLCLIPEELIPSNEGSHSTTERPILHRELDTKMPSSKKSTVLMTCSLEFEITRKFANYSVVSFQYVVV